MCEWGDCKNVLKQPQIKYNRWLANTVHDMGMTCAYKNCLGLFKELHDYYDYAINEECSLYNECGSYGNTFLKNNKAVFALEYKSSSSAAKCSDANKINLSRKYSKNSDGNHNGHYLLFFLKI